jgi:transcription antitermination factor NusG
MTNNETGSAYHPGIDDGAMQSVPALGGRQPEIYGGLAPNGRRASDADELTWFAVVTRSRHEWKVRDQLESRDVESFLPYVQRWSRWRDRRKLIEWPLFPGYCFARCSSRNVRPVLACKGVVHVVSFAARPAPVPDYEIEGIRQLLASTLPHDPCPFVDVGMFVEVVHGPLRGVRGRLVRKDRSTRLVLAVEMLGRALSVQIDAADVKPLPS